MADKRTWRANPALFAPLLNALLMTPLFLASCSKPDDPAARIKATISAMEEAIETHKAGDFVAHVTDDFAGEGGQVDQRTLRGIITSQLLGNQTIEVTLGSPEVKLHNDELATVSVTAFVIGGRFLPERGESIAIKSGWRLEDGEWKCYSAEWDR